MGSESESLVRISAVLWLVHICGLGLGFLYYTEQLGLESESESVQCEIST